MKSRSRRALVMSAFIVFAGACSPSNTPGSPEEPRGGAGHELAGNSVSAGGSLNGRAGAAGAGARGGAGGEDDAGAVRATGGTTRMDGGPSGGTAGAGGASASGGAGDAGRRNGEGGMAGHSGTRATGGAPGAGGHPGSGGELNLGGGSGSGRTTDGGTEGPVGPCDIYASGKTPCVAAHSTVRALFGSYNGKLYQIRRADNTTKDISTLAAGGFADGEAQDDFCSGTTCVMTVVYDQSGKGNDLWYQGSSAVPGSNQSKPAVANKESLTVGGHKVYSLYIEPNNSYWRDGSKSGVPTDSAPEGMYMVTSGTHVNGGCCFDYGNSETTRKADNAGAMDAINFSTQCWFGGCSGSGPWVQADLEWGLYPGGSQSWNPNQKALKNKYVTAMLKNDGTTKFAIKGANAESDALTTFYEGKLPSGYSPMKKQGAIVLGSGGDCCKPGGGANLSAGTFYEGAIVSGYPTDAIDDAIQDNIIAAGYGATVARP